MSGKRRATAKILEGPKPGAFSDEQLRTLSVLLDRQAYMRVAGLQFDGRRDLYNIFGYDRVITSTQYRDEYARGGIAKRIVEAFPKATWRGGVELYEDEDPEITTPFEQAWSDLEKQFGIWNKLQNADILAGLSTYSVILIGAPGDLSSELPRGSKLLYLQPFFGGGGPGSQRSSVSARMISSEQDVTIETFDLDPQSERFGEPLAYRIRRTDISSPEFAREVHWTRVIHVAEGALDNNVYGVPTLESIWNLLFDLEKITGGGAENSFQRAKHTLHANIDKDVSFTPEQMTDLQTLFDQYQHNMTDFLPTRGVDLKLLEAQTSMFGPNADAILKQIAGSKGIPMRILTGSEMGSLASEQDANNFDSQVQDRRTGYAGPMIVRKLVDRLIEYGYLPTPKQYDIGWPVEENLDEAGKADYASKLASVNKTFDGVVFTEDEIREMAFDREPLPDAETSEELSENQKADIAFKLASTNKAMGITIFTDDEIRKITYGFEPLSDDEKVPIGAPEKISVTEPPPIGEDGQPVPQLDASGQPITKADLTPPAPAKPVPAANPALKAAEDAELLRVFEAAIRAKDRKTIDRILFGPEARTYDTIVAMLSEGLGTEGLTLARQFCASIDEQLLSMSDEDLFTAFEAYRQQHAQFDMKRQEKQS